MLLCAHCLYPCKTDRTWAGIFCPASHALSLCASAKFPYALQPHKATIVLSVFTRSFPADEEEIIKKLLEKKASALTTRAGQRKEPAGSVEASLLS